MEVIDHFFVTGICVKYRTCGFSGEAQFTAGAAMLRMLGGAVAAIV
jgi:hypothetical protein